MKIPHIQKNGICGIFIWRVNGVSKIKLGSIVYLYSYTTASSLDCIFEILLIVFSSTGNVKL